jgi:hypothetical protein
MAAGALSLRVQPWQVNTRTTFSTHPLIRLQDISQLIVIVCMKSGKKTPDASLRAALINRTDNGWIAFGKRVVLYAQYSPPCDGRVGQ